jgi:hypothetical protein
VGDDSEEGSQVDAQAGPAAVHWGGGCWENEESEEECEFTDREEFEFNENAFQKLFTGAYNISVSEGSRLHFNVDQYAYTTASKEEST